jgi:hypothetical protein
MANPQCLAWYAEKAAAHLAKAAAASSRSG